LIVEPDNLVLEQLRALRGENAKIMDWMQTISAEVTAIRQHLGGVVTIQELDHADIAGIKVRLDRIEKRLELVG
jgi:hypothetical protein